MFEPFLKTWFEDRKWSLLTCADSSRYSREERFTTISVDVRSHNNLLDSLNEYVKGDLLTSDNAYHCEQCQMKVFSILCYHVNHCKCFCSGLLFFSFYSLNKNFVCYMYLYWRTHLLALAISWKDIRSSAEILINHTLKWNAKYLRCEDARAC